MKNMKNTKKLLVAASVTTWILGPSPATAHAAPEPANTPDKIEGDSGTTAEGGEDEYSNINGQLVPVGEKNRFRYAYARFNVDANPLGPLFGLWSVGLTYAVAENVAVRGDMSYFGPYDEDVSGVDASLNAKIFFKKMHDGWFLEPGIRLLWGQAAGSDGSRDSGVAVGPQVLIGGQWIWDSGFNVGAAFGLSRALFGDLDHRDNVILPAGYVRVGKTF